MELAEYRPTHSHSGANDFEASDKWGECFEEKPLRRSVGKYDYVTHSVFCLGKDTSKPPVVLLHELPGLTPMTLSYAEELSKDFTVYVPMLYGSFNQSNRLETTLPIFNIPFHREWSFQEELEGSTRIIVWLREVVKEIEKRHKGVAIGVIGNCLTGSLPLALLDNQSIGAVVIAQPALPLRVFRKYTDFDKKSLELSAKEWEAAKNNTAPIYGVRFKYDRISPEAKFDELKSPDNHFIDHFINAEISEAEYLGKESPESHKKAHSTLISEYDTGGLVTKASRSRRDEVCSFLKDPTGFRRGDNKCSKSAAPLLIP